MVLMLKPAGTKVCSNTCEAKNVSPQGDNTELLGALAQVQ